MMAFQHFLVQKIPNKQGHAAWSGVTKCWTEINCLKYIKVLHLL
jgi:hypothetical protein